MDAFSPPPETPRRTRSASHVQEENTNVFPQKFPQAFQECTTHEEQTVWIVKKLWECSFNEVHELLAVSVEREGPPDSTALSPYGRSRSRSDYICSDTVSNFVRGIL